MKSKSNYKFFFEKKSELEKEVKDLEDLLMFKNFEKTINNIEIGKWNIFRNKSILKNILGLSLGYFTDSIIRKRIKNYTQDKKNNFISEILIPLTYDVIKYYRNNKK